jgi:hypothetical protein
MLWVEKIDKLNLKNGGPNNQTRNLMTTLKSHKPLNYKFSCVL